MNKFLKEMSLRLKERFSKEAKFNKIDSLSITSIGLSMSGVNVINPGVTSSSSYLDC